MGACFHDLMCLRADAGGHARLCHSGQGSTDSRPQKDRILWSCRGGMNECPLPVSGANIRVTAGSRRLRDRLGVLVGMSSATACYPVGMD